MKNHGNKEQRPSSTAALAFFDLFDYPLTMQEMARFAYRTDTRIEADVSRHSDGYFHLPGRETIVSTRNVRYTIAERKMKIASKVTRWLSLLPSVRMVAACNSLALANASEESDIDLFVVTSDGTPWITRFIAATVLTLLGLRPDNKTHKDKICLSFIVSEKSLNLLPLADGDDDPYLRYWIATLVPVYGTPQTIRHFFSRNSWIKERLPNVGSPEISIRHGVPIRPRRPKAIVAMRALEPWARRFQERIFPSQIRDALGKGTEVVASSSVLKFHVGDRRREIADKFEDSLLSLGHASAERVTV